LLGGNRETIGKAQRQIKIAISSCERGEKSPSFYEKTHKIAFFFENILSSSGCRPRI
jgi:hypothetical protein